MPGTITFSEVPVGTVDPVYNFGDNRVVVDGVVVRDGAQPASPAVAANSQYNGPVFIYFDTPVESVSLDVGYFDNNFSTSILFIGQDGQVLRSFSNTGLGVIRYSHTDMAGIAAVHVLNRGYDAAGFSVDTISFGENVDDLLGPGLSIVPFPDAAVRADAVRMGELNALSVAPPDLIGGTDDYDYFRFELAEESFVRFTASLYNDSNATTVFNQRLAAGVYYLKVDGSEYDSLQSYRLVMEARDASLSEQEIVDLFGMGADSAEVIGKFRDVLNALPGDKAWEVFDAVLKGLGRATGAIDVGFRVDAVRTAPDPRRQAIVELIDFGAGVAAMAGAGALVAFLAPLAVPGLVAGAFAGLGIGATVVYGTQFSDAVRNLTGRLYDNWSGDMLDMTVGTEPVAADLDLIFFDPTYYLANHPDAAAAVASGDAASAYAHFIAIGAALGYRPAANEPAVNPADLAIRFVGNDPTAGGRAAALTTSLGQYVGDGASTTELALATAINNGRPSSDPIQRDGALFALANRLAVDLQANGFENAHALDAAGRLQASMTTSNGSTLAQLFPSTPMGDVQVFVATTEAADAAAALAVFLRQPEALTALTLAGSNRIGIAEFGGVWVLLVGTATAGAAPLAETAFTLRSAGSDNGDYLVAGNHAAVLSGGAGADQLVGGSAADELDGGAGDDRIAGGAGDDVLNGGSGVDTLDYSLAAGAVTVHLQSGVASRDGHSGRDRIAGFEDVIGSDHADSLVGDAGGNRLEGRAGSDVLIGLGGDDILVGGAGAANELYGGAGNDRYIVAAADTIIELANEGVDTVETSLTRFALAANLENLTFSGDAAFTGTGNASANIITGGSGDDVLAGLGGNDTLVGGAGSDTADYSAASGGVVSQLFAGRTQNDGQGGTDQLDSVENLIGSAFDDVLTGSGANNRLVGGAGRDVLMGLNGNDILVGGAGAANELHGGLGDDRYVVEAGDSIIELAGEGVDTVETAMSQHRLAANVENLSYTGTETFLGVGNASANVISGGLGRDTLLGLAGDDILIGGAGAANTVQGGAGNDTYVLDVSDSVVELAGDGTDLVQLRGLRAYNLGANVENATAVATGDYVINGNVLDNVLTGAAGADILQGGAGNDTLNGGAGIDTVTYILSTAGVTARLDTNRSTNDGLGGQDTFTSIENLTGSNLRDTLMGNAGNNLINGAIGDDVLLGFDGDDTLIGGSGGGNNEMYGGRGNDLYIVDALDTLIELEGEGTDTVQTTMGNFTLRAHIENMIYVGPGDFAGTGNAQNNVITGSGGNDTLAGRGGNDTLNGGAGADLALLQGVRADYTITSISGGWRVVDNVTGRDGTDLLYGVESVRFADGTVLVLGQQAAEPTFEVMPLSPTDKELVDDPFVLPPLSESKADDGALVLPPLTSKGEMLDEPLVLPGIDTAPLPRTIFDTEGSGLVVHAPHGPHLLDIDLVTIGTPHDPWA